MISMKEMMLKPRQRPKRPPREATKSTGFILTLLSISIKILLDKNVKTGKLGKYFQSMKILSEFRYDFVHKNCVRSVCF